MTDLGDEMRALADSRHPEALELRAKADAFDAAAEGYYGYPQTVDAKSFLGTWARARRLYARLTGQTII